MFLRWILASMVIFVIKAMFITDFNPKFYKSGDQIPIKAVKLLSDKRLLSYSYYKMPMHCKPPGGVKYERESLSEILSGDRIMNTGFEVTVLKNELCKVLCASRQFRKSEVQEIKNFIKNNYRVQLMADNLNGVQINTTDSASNRIGYSLGIFANNEYIIHNHLKFNFLYNLDKKSSLVQIVDFSVGAQSIAKVQENNMDKKCSIPLERSELKLDAHSDSLQTSLTYEIFWQETDTQWSQRWDSYLRSHSLKIHSFSIFNSFLIVAFVAIALAVFLVRMVKRDIYRYNSQSEDDILDESGWKLTHGDVFRPPKQSLILCVLVGTGTQLLLALTGVAGLALFGWISATVRGSTMKAGLILYVMGGLLSGYYTSRLYKSLDGKEWKKAAFNTALLFPSLTMGIIVVISVIVSTKHSTNSIPVSWIFYLIAGWIFLLMPTVFAGYYLGYKKAPHPFPFRPNRIPRIVPAQPRYLNHFYSSLIGGILPFTVLLIDIHFVYESLWKNGLYLFLSHMIIALLLYVISICEMSIFTTYRILHQEDYRWWWKSFTAPAGTAIYVFLYSIYYYIFMLDHSSSMAMGIVSKLFYFAYSSLICLTIGIMSGTVGFWSSFVFVRKIFSYLKID